MTNSNKISCAFTCDQSNGESWEFWPTQDRNPMQVVERAPACTGGVRSSNWTLGRGWRSLLSQLLQILLTTREGGIAKLFTVIISTIHFHFLWSNRVSNKTAFIYKASLPNLLYGGHWFWKQWPNLQAQLPVQDPMMFSDFWKSHYTSEDPKPGYRIHVRIRRHISRAKNWY